MSPELDVIKNPKSIKIVPLENAQAPRALGDADFAAVQGNFAIYSGLKLTEAFALEKMTKPYTNVVAVSAGQCRGAVGEGHRCGLSIGHVQDRDPQRQVLCRLHPARILQLSATYARRPP